MATVWTPKPAMSITMLGAASFANLQTLLQFCACELQSSDKLCMSRLAKAL